MNKEIGAVILSRFSSSRLPGKALLKIEGKTVLTYIIERLLIVFKKDQLVIATSEEYSDDPIVEYAMQQGISCFRGSLNNVAERFLLAAKSKGWEFGVRINGDNIFVDSNVLSNMCEIALTNTYDFVSNVKGRTFPKGMSIEIVRLNHYEDSLKTINSSIQYQEHVTSYLYENDIDKRYYYYLNAIAPEAAGLQLALDTQEDFDRSARIIKQFTRHQATYNMKEILQIYKEAKIDE